MKSTSAQQLSNVNNKGFGTILPNNANDIMLLLNEIITFTKKLGVEITKEMNLDNSSFAESYSSKREKNDSSHQR